MAVSDGTGKLVMESILETKPRPTLLGNWTRDGRITNPEYIDAGDVVIAQFNGEGPNDGPFGSLKPTGRRMSLQFCEVWHFDKERQMVSGNGYCDQYTLLTQLGHIQPLAAAA